MTTYIKATITDVMLAGVKMMTQRISSPGNHMRQFPHWEQSNGLTCNQNPGTVLAVFFFQRCSKQKFFKYCLPCWRSQSKKVIVNAIQTQDDGLNFLQQDIQILLLHFTKSIRLYNKVFNKNNLCKTKATADHPCALVKISKHCTNKSAWDSALADTGAQLKLRGRTFKKLICVRNI